MRWHEDWVRRKLPLVLLVIGIATLFVLRLLVRVSATPDLPKISERNAEEFRAFSVWATSFAGLMVALTWAAIVGANIAKQYLSKKGYRYALIISGVFTLAAALLSRLLWHDRDLLAIVERARSIPIRSVTLVGNALAVGSATLVVAACIALATSSRLPSLAELRRRVAESRLLLFSAAVFLVVGVAEIYMVFQLPVAVEKTRIAMDAPKVLQHIAGSITLIAGVWYTAVFLILFVPVAVIHEKWIDEVWQSAGGQKHSEWLESAGLHRSIASTASQLVAAAAPLLAALGLTPS